MGNACDNRPAAAIKAQADLDPNGGCNYVPQGQLFDQGTVTVDDPCTGTGCPSGCGYDDAHVRSMLDAILPPAWCGEASP